ncbi:hypothetical protein QYC35_07365 [Ligilactobacillus salivarius]|uniref:Uncharacterized protein n=1 Tax=Ligilactobacillus salivarius TaxID=1624 RepID=A0AAW7NA43_9LACO|nr:hypothetical protein [Ligilactobacillus salivarius]MDN4834016.1 hypothetical protein [Ligilactobacillus salivarius]
MKINYESDSSKNMYQVGNVIRTSDEGLYLIADNPEGEIFAVDLHTNLVYGAYKTMNDLFNDIEDEDNVLVHAEINVF